MQYCPHCGKSYVDNSKAFHKHVTYCPHNKELVAFRALCTQASEQIEQVRLTATSLSEFLLAIIPIYQTIGININISYYPHEYVIYQHYQNTYPAYRGNIIGEAQITNRLIFKREPKETMEFNRLVGYWFNYFIPEAPNLEWLGSDVIKLTRFPAAYELFERNGIEQLEVRDKELSTAWSAFNSRLLDTYNRKVWSDSLLNQIENLTKNLESALKQIKSADLRQRSNLRQATYAENRPEALANISKPYNVPITPALSTFVPSDKDVQESYIKLLAHLEKYNNFVSNNPELFI